MLEVWGCALNKNTDAECFGDGQKLSKEEAQEWANADLTWDYPSGPGEPDGSDVSGGDWLAIEEDGTRHNFYSNKEFQEFLKQAYNL